MDVIRVMDDTLASQVSAGEVIERPVSIVRELIDNSIDSGASKIEIYLRNGGKTFIQVIDNGKGMTKNDALLSIERHSSSKVKKLSDLNNITTRGFRGEALPSIASVSRLEIITKYEDSEIGTKLFIEGGRLKNVQSFGIALGTNVVVKDLFFNVPARRKYLRAELTEFKHIEQLIKEVSIAFPNISFSLYHGGKQIFSHLKNNNYLDRIRSLVGSDIAMKLKEIKETKTNISLYGKNFEISLKGFVSRENVGWGSGKLQYFYINKRSINNVFLRKCIRDIFKNVLDKKLFPINFIFFEIPPDFYDINVHPTKKEVRFLNIDVILDFLRKSIINVLGEFKVSGLDGGENYDSQKESFTEIEEKEFGNIEKYKIHNESFLNKNSNYLPSNESKTIDKSVFTKRLVKRDNNFRFNPTISIKPSQVNFENYQSNEVNDSESKYDNNLVYNYLGVLVKKRHKFGIFNNNEGLVLMNIKFSQERIHYEKILKDALSSKFTEGSSKVIFQELIIPVIIEMTPSDFELVINSSNYLRRFGIYVEDFGNNSIKIEKLPNYLNNESDIKNIIIDLLENHRNLFKNSLNNSKLKDNFLNKENEKGSENPYLKENLIKIAKSITRKILINKFFREEDVKNILKELLETDLPYCSPDGKPTLVMISNSEILKKFLL